MKSRRVSEIGSYALEMLEDEGLAVLVDAHNNRRLAVPLTALASLSAMIQTGLEESIYSRFVRPGKIYKENLSNSDSISEQSVLMQELESLKPGKSERASHWWLTFIKDNISRPGLIIATIAELKHREASVDDFFNAYVYSGTDNIQANLHFMDYRRASVDCLTTGTSDEAVAASKAVLTRVERSRTSRGISEQQRVWWNNFEKQAFGWNYDDALALCGIAENLASVDSFIKLAIASDTTRPLAMFHYLECLRIEYKMKGLLAALQYDESILSTEVTNKLKILACWGYPAESLTGRLFSVKELESGLSDFPCQLTPRRARELVKNVHLEGPPTPEELECLKRTVQFRMSEDEIAESIGIVSLDKAS